MFPKSKEFDATGCMGVGGSRDDDSDGERDEEREETDAAPLGTVGAVDGAKAVDDEPVLKRSMSKMSSRAKFAGICC